MSNEQITPDYLKDDNSIFEFKRVWQGSDFNIDEESIVSIRNCCKKIHNAGLTPPFLVGKYIGEKFVEPDGSSCGNVAVLTQNGIIVTCSRLKSKDKISNDNLALVERIDTSSMKTYYFGKNKCSSESHIHKMTIDYFNGRGIQIGASIHYHETDDDLLGIAYECEDIPFTKRKDPEGSLGGLESLRELYNKYPNKRIFGMKGHGMICIGKTLEEATNRALKKHKELLTYSKPVMPFFP